MGHSVEPGLQGLVQNLPPNMETHFMPEGQLPSWAQREQVRRGRQYRVLPEAVSHSRAGGQSRSVLQVPRQKVPQSYWVPTQVKPEGQEPVAPQNLPMSELKDGLTQKTRLPLSELQI